MNAVDIYREVRTLRDKVTTLQDERARYAARRDQELAVEPPRFDQNYVNAAKREINRVEGQIGILQERIAALESQLPDAKEISTAMAAARSACVDAQAAHTQFTAAWTQFRRQADAAADAGRSVACAAAVARTASAKVRDLVARFGLDLSVPGVPMPDRDEMEIVGLLSVIIRHVADHQDVYDAAERELSATRSRRGEPIIA